MHTLNTFPNQLRLVCAPMSGVDSVTVMILVGAGSRYESKDNNGISHFLEHMFFKGGVMFPTPKSVSHAVDSIGGMSNAFTDKEYVGYYVKVSKHHVETAFALLADMLLDSKFPEEEIDKERGVIAEELNMYQDSPSQQIFWDFERQLFGDQPIGWDEGGTKEFLQRVQREDFLRFKKRLYTPDNCVVTVAGNVDPDRIATLVEKYFSRMSGTKEYLSAALEHSEVLQTKLSIRKKPTDQAHVMLGIQGIAYPDAKRWPLKIASTILGGNSSSRMFQHLREELGLCYSVHTGTTHYKDCGTLYAKAGVSLENTEKAVEAIIQTFLESVEKNPVTADEVDSAKEYLKGTMSLVQEDTEEVALFHGRQLLFVNQVHTKQDIDALIDAVTLADVQQALTERCYKNALCVSLIGPFDELPRVHEFLHTIS